MRLIQIKPYTRAEMYNKPPYSALSNEAGDQYEVAERESLGSSSRQRHLTG